VNDTSLSWRQGVLPALASFRTARSISMRKQFPWTSLAVIVWPQKSQVCLPVTYCYTAFQATPRWRRLIWWHMSTRWARNTLQCRGSTAHRDVAWLTEAEWLPISAAFPHADSTRIGETSIPSWMLILLNYFWMIVLGQTGKLYYCNANYFHWEKKLVFSSIYSIQFSYKRKKAATHPKTCFVFFNNNNFVFVYTQILVAKNNLN
jgi:hypothetical protein